MFFPGFRVTIVVRGRPNIYISETGLNLRLRSGARPLREKAQGAESEFCDCYSTDPETGVASGKTEAAICVQDVDVQCVLQFTLIHAAGCALHRHTSRVIHRLELYFPLFVPSRRKVQIGRLSRGTTSRQRMNVPRVAEESKGIETPDLRNRTVP